MVLEVRFYHPGNNNAAGAMNQQVPNIINYVLSFSKGNRKMSINVENFFRRQQRLAAGKEAEERLRGSKAGTKEGLSL